MDQYDYGFKRRRSPWKRGRAVCAVAVAIDIHIHVPFLWSSLTSLQFVYTFFLMPSLSLFPSNTSHAQIPTLIISSIPSAATTFPRLFYLSHCGWQFNYCYKINSRPKNSLIINSLILFFKLFRYGLVYGSYWPELKISGA